MDKEILAIIKDVSLWQGDIYKLVALVVEKQKELDAKPVEEED